MKHTSTIYIIVCVLAHTSTINSDCTNRSSQQPQQSLCLPETAQRTTLCTWAGQLEKVVYYEKPLEGFIDVELPKLLPYNVSSYEIRLQINRTDKATKTCDKDFNGNSWVTSLDWDHHSRITYNVQPNSTNPLVTFEYVFSGCYVLQVFNGMNCLYQSHPTLITSKYNRKRLIDRGVIAILKPRAKKSPDFEVALKLNAMYVRKPPSISTILVTTNISLESETQVNFKDNKLKEYNESFTRCGSFFNITWKCNYSEDTKVVDDSIWYICNYKGLPVGEYIYKFSLLDEYTRCCKDTVWTAAGDSCTWWKKIVVEYISYNTTKIDEPKENVYTEYIIISAITVIILLCLLMSVYRRYSAKTKKYKTQPTSQENQYLTLQEELPLLATQEIVIIYARDSELFLAMIESFKQLLSSVDKNVPVHDINVHNEAMCVDPEIWIKNKFSNEKTKFVFVLNKCGITIFENYTNTQKRPKIAYREAKWQDNMFLYAVKLLQNTEKINYRNLFVAGTTSCNSSVFDHINTNTRFTLPDTIENLLNHIFPGVKCSDNTFLMDFNERCCKYDEFCETNQDYVNNILQVE